MVDVSSPLIWKFSLYNSDFIDNVASIAALFCLIIVMCAIMFASIWSNFIRSMRSSYAMMFIFANCAVHILPRTIQFLLHFYKDSLNPIADLILIRFSILAISVCVVFPQFAMLLIDYRCIIVPRFYSDLYIRSLLIVDSLNIIGMTLYVSISASNHMYMKLKPFLNTFSFPVFFFNLFILLRWLYLSFIEKRVILRSSYSLRQRLVIGLLTLSLSGPSLIHFVGRVYLTAFVCSRQSQNDSEFWKQSKIIDSYFLASNIVSGAMPIVLGLVHVFIDEARPHSSETLPIKPCGALINLGSSIDLNRKGLNDADFGVASDGLILDQQLAWRAVSLAITGIIAKLTL